MKSVKDEAREAHDLLIRIRGDAEKNIELALQLGRKLLSIKKRIRHGNMNVRDNEGRFERNEIDISGLQRYFQDHIGINPRTARMYMRVAKIFDASPDTEKRQLIAVFLKHGITGVSRELATEPDREEINTERRERALKAARSRNVERELQQMIYAQSLFNDVWADDILPILRGLPDKHSDEAREYMLEKVNGQEPDEHRLSLKALRVRRRGRARFASRG